MKIKKCIHNKGGFFEGMRLLLVQKFIQIIEVVSSKVGIQGSLIN